MEGESTAVKAYILLSTSNGDTEEMAQTLRKQPGVKLVDILEEPYGAIMLIEASERQKLADLTVQALAAVQSLTSDIKLLMTRD